MLLSARLKLLGKSLGDFAPLGFPTETRLRRWVFREFGSLEVLERAMMKAGRRVRVISPRSIYHLGARNLSVSLWQSLLVGMVLGAKNFVKPASGTLPELKWFLRKIPRALRSSIQIREKFNSEEMREADAVIAFGKDETLESLHPHPKQRFLAYGHRVSLIWVARDTRWSASLGRRLIEDLTAYQQQGCLSPQLIILERGQDPERFGENLSRAWQRRGVVNPKVSISVAAQIQEIRDTARGKGERVWASPQGVDWTVIQARSKPWQWHTLPHLIPIVVAPTGNWEKELTLMRGHLSTVGVVGKLSEKAEERFLSLGAVRFCPVGQMQKPSLDWLHDGRPQLSDLVRWVEG